METETTELIMVEELNAVELFTGDAMEPLIARIRGVVDGYVPDVSTDKGRREIASLARRVASSKVILDDLGKNLVAEWKEKAKKVDTVRKEMRDELDIIRDEARLPLTRYEEEEAARTQQEALAKELSKAWDEAYAEYDLRERERIVREKEEAFAKQEAERKAKEEAERLAKERREREERIAKSAAENAKREAEAALAFSMAVAEQVERDKIAAQERAKIEQAEAVRRAEQRAKEEAARVEQERIAKEKAEAEKQRRLEADKQHRLKIQKEAMASAEVEGLPDIRAWIKAIATGKIKNVMIHY